MKSLNKCPIDVLDDIFYSTKESQGFENAVLAIKYVLFDDETVFDGEKPNSNKYLYISNINNARKKAMLLQRDDLAHILIKYSMQSFGLRGTDFSIRDNDFIEIERDIDTLDKTAYEMIEVISYAALGNVYNAYSLLFENKKILLSIVDYLINERYISDIAKILDNFSGIIDNNDINTDQRYSFYQAYSKLDDNFAEIKKNNPDYIK